MVDTCHDVVGLYFLVFVYSSSSVLFFFFLVFFFQAEDGIRDWSVTGVQTCALPISMSLFLPADTMSLSLPA